MEQGEEEEEKTAVDADADAAVAVVDDEAVVEALSSSTWRNEIGEEGEEEEEGELVAAV